MIDLDTDCRLVRAKHVQPGDTVCFHMPAFNYKVTRTDPNCGPDGTWVRHYHGDDDSSDTWEPDQLLCVLNP